MKNNGTVLVITVISGILLSIFPRAMIAAEQRYVWPIEIVGDISGNFGECRFDHFHAGLDIATHQKVGYKLYAIDGGYVYRLKMSAGGYGRAIYLKLNDGRYVVYAHCERFVEPVQQYIEQIQRKEGSYEVDHYVPENMFTFNKGAVIAYSGKSGDVAPHLHIELRNEREEPINILSHGLELAQPDVTVPVMEHLSIKPISFNSFADNSLHQNIYPLTQINDTTYTINRPIYAWGKLGLKLNTIDYDNTQGYRLAPYSATLTVDGRQYYSIKMDRIAYGVDYNDNFFLYDRELKYMVSSSVSGDYLRLFSLPATDLIVTRHNDHDGYLLCGDSEYAGSPYFLGPGDHKVTIAVADIAGNTATLHCTVRVEYPAILAKTTSTLPGDEVMSPVNITPNILLYDDFFSILLTTSRSMAKLPAVQIVHAAETLEPVHKLARTATEFEYVFAPQKEFSGAATMIVRYTENHIDKQLSRMFTLNYIPKQDTPSVVRNQIMELRFPSTGRALIPFVEPVEDSPAHKAVSMRKLSATYRIKPNGFQLHDPATLQFTVTQRMTGMPALFEWIDNRWRLLYPINTGSKQAVGATIRHLSTYAVFSDSMPPRIAFINPKQPNTIFKAGDTIVCTATDDEVGIAYKQVVMTIGDKRVPAEYNFDTSSIAYTIDDTLPVGTQEVAVHVSDRLGNSTTRSITIIIE